MSTTSDPPGGPPCGNPYTVLGLEHGATDAEITKAYRKLALKIHPDKQRPGMSKSESERVAKRFHDANEARAFLLEPERAEDRRKYDSTLISWAARRVEDERRERGMSDRRKRMREDLVDKERRAASGDARERNGRGGDGGNEGLVDRLRREGKAMRERYGNQRADEEARRESRERKKRKTVLEGRQVRVKWSRKKVGISHSEHSLASLLSKFGDVTKVELIGAKGNAALVTFANPCSCASCVKEYLDSDVMRATFVGKRKEEEDGGIPATFVPSPRAAENLEDRKLRQAAERERLLRRMEMDEAGVEIPDYGKDKHVTFSAAKRASEEKTTAVETQRRRSCVEFPPKFPKGDNNTPMNQLERAELVILGSLLPEDALRRIQVRKAN